MSKKRFRKVMGYIRDNTLEGGDLEGVMDLTEIEDMLNKLNDERMMYKTTIDKRIVELQEENEQLRKYNRQLNERLERINGGYGHLTHRNGLTANEWLIESQEKELKKKNEQISEWIEQHSKDIAKISEQNKLIQKLKEENESLNEENAKLLSERIKDLEMFEEVADKLKSIAKENEQLRRYVYHCPQICNIILAYLRKSETEDVKAVSDAMGDDEYFDEEIDTLRSWE